MKKVGYQVFDSVMRVPGADESRLLIWGGSV